MKRVIATVIAFCLLFPRLATAVVVGDGISRLESNKIVTIVGVIDDAMTESVRIQLLATANIPGARVVLIRSPGGSIDEGHKIIKMLEDERARTHQKIMCVAIKDAHSMAFSILTHCDVRMATADSTMVVHKVALGGDPGIRMSAKNMRQMADEMDKDDEPMIEENRAAMHLSRKDYDKYADVERRWTAKELLAMHYLSLIVRVSE